MCLLIVSCRALPQVMYIWVSGGQVLVPRSTLTLTNAYQTIKSSMGGKYLYLFFRYAGTAFEVYNAWQELGDHGTKVSSR